MFGYYDIGLRQCAMRMLMSSPARRSAFVWTVGLSAAAICAGSLSGCAQDATTSTATGNAAPTSAPHQSSAPAATSEVAQRYQDFTWGDGKTTPGMAVGIPDPPGWYEAAFGPRTTEKVLYLTYDDGPYPPTTDRILKLLAKNNAKATFFVNGRQVDQYPGYLEKVITAGHAIGNHTQDHENVAAKGRKIIRKQLTDVVDVVGPKMGDCMRPPGGRINQKAGDIITGMGIVPIMWTGHAQDWTPPSTERMVEMLKSATAPGAVILLHDSADKERTIAASAQMIPWWTKHGYRLETVPACRK